MAKAAHMPLPNAAKKGAALVLTGGGGCGNARRHRAAAPRGKLL
jgi:hypothetical protein